MRTLLSVVLIICLGSFGQASAAPNVVTCKALTALPATEQKLFVDGMVNGMGMTFGVLDSFYKLLSSRSASKEEQSGIDKMHALPHGFMVAGQLTDTNDILDGVIKKCTASPDSYAANEFLDVMSGR